MKKIFVAIAVAMFLVACPDGKQADEAKVAPEKKQEQTEKAKGKKVKLTAENLKDVESVPMTLEVSKYMKMGATMKGTSPSECDVCVSFTTEVIKDAAAVGSCWGGELALNAIFAVADVAFIECCDEFLVPIEAIIDTAWGVTCGEIGVAALGKHPDKYAKQWCEPMCK